MINEKSIEDREAYDLFRRALQDLMMTFPLCGLSYLGSAVEVREDARVKTMETDGRIVYYGPAWVKKLDHRGRVFDVLHEWLHIFFNHVARKGDRDGKIWNIACDVVVVRECCSILSKPNDPVSAPADGVIPPAWANGLTAEQIYDELISKRQQIDVPESGGEHQTSSDFRYDSAAVAMTSLDEEFRRKFTEELAQAAMIQQHIHQKTVEQMFGSAIGKRLDEVLKGRVPWSRLLRGDLIDAMGDEFTTFSPPRRRYFPEILLPSMRSYSEKILFLGIDVSASVGPTLMGHFKSNVMPAAMRAKQTVIATFDETVREVVKTRHPQRVLADIKFLTGAHRFTSTIDMFKLVDEIRPTAIAVLTDGYVHLPEKEYDKTLWVIPENGNRLPWGRNYVMDVSW